MSAGRLPGRTALVTGGSRGIGRAICLALARAGARVALTYRARSEEAEETVRRIHEAAGQTRADRGEDLAADVGAPGDLAVAVRADVTAPAEVERAVALVAERMGEVDILVNNAGTHADGLIFDMDEEKFSGVVEVNLKGAYRFTRAVARGMMMRRWGRIVNVSSVSGHWGGRGKSNYAASKGALDAFTRAVAMELASRGITVNAVAPGMIETEMTQEVLAHSGEKLLERIPSRRLGRPEDVAGLVAFLASDEAAYLTGQVITVDGGLSVQ